MAQNNQNSNKYNVKAKQTFSRKLTRKNPQTGKYNYPTVVTRRTTITNSDYIKQLKTITRKVYKRIIKPND